MQIMIKGTNLDLTDAMSQYAEEKIGSVDKYFDNIIEVRVELERTTMHHQSGEIFRCEVNLVVPQKGVLRAESTESDMYAAIDTVVPKLREAIEKYKGQHFSEDRKFRRQLKSIFAWRPWQKRK